MMQQIDTRLPVVKTQSSTLPNKVIYILVQLRSSPWIVRWTFLLFIFTIPFENISLEAIRGVSSVSRLAGLLFFSACLFYPRVCFRRPPPALWWFAAYAAVCGLRGLLIPEEFLGRFIGYFQMLIQLLVLCWIGSTLLQEEKFTKHALLIFSIAVLLSAIGMLLRLPGFSKTLANNRLSAAGFNPNGFAVIMALGTQTLIWFGIGQTLRNRWVRMASLAMSTVSLAAMVYTGSRGGIAAFVIGTVLYALPYRRSKRKMIAILGVAIAIVSIAYTVVHNQGTLSRFEETYETGSTTGRSTIFAAAIEMIFEKPLLGWQPLMHSYELGSRLGVVVRDTHNLFLHLLTEGGLLGAMPFFIGLGLCVRAAWTARDSSLGLLPLVWLTTILVSSMSGTNLTRKILWLVLMLSLASEAFIVNQSRRKNLITKTILPPSTVQKVQKFNFRGA
jgi:O-antigen ligase